MNKKHLAYVALSPVANLTGKAFQRPLRVLAYHTVPSPELYDAQLRYLRKAYNFISLDDLIASLEGHIVLPRRSVLITFDDGDYSVLEHGLPLHQKYGIPAVLFVISDLIGTSNPFWWRKVEMHFSKMGYSYAQARQKIAALKEMSNEDRVTYLKSLPDNYRQQQLTLSDLKALHRGGIAIANHTATHPLVNRCSEEELHLELGRATMALSTIEGGYPGVFAYPNGNADDTSDRLLREWEIQVAFLFDHRLSTNLNDPLRISRLRVNTYDSLPEFRAKVSGLHSLLYNLRT